MPLRSVAGLFVALGLAACTPAGEPATADPATAVSDTAEAAPTRPDAIPAVADAAPPTVAPAPVAPALVVAPELKRLLDAEGRAALRIDFQPGTATLSADGLALVGEVARMLAADAATRLIIEAHTDAPGGPDASRALSQAQAEAVVAALVARGVAPGRLDAVGYGSDNPLVRGDDEATRARNRRVELVRKSPRAP